MNDNTSQRALRIGSVPYLNADPLTFGLESNPEVKLEHAVPSKLLDRLLAGELDCAFAPTFDILHHPELPVVEGLAVSSFGPVASVVLLAKKPLHLLKTVGLDTSSRSSAGLTRVLLAEGYGVIPEYVPVRPEPKEALRKNDAVLLIGDQALMTLDQKEIEAEVFDLGTLWTDMTGLPFVYAMFVAGPTVATDQLFEVLHASKTRGLQSRSLLADRASKNLNIQKSVLDRYLTENIRYDLGPQEFAGIDLYRRLLIQHGVLAPRFADCQLQHLSKELAGADGEA